MPVIPPDEENRKTADPGADLLHDTPDDDARGVIRKSLK
jgi:hypothetical protein